MLVEIHLQQFISHISRQNVTYGIVCPLIHLRITKEIKDVIYPYVLLGLIMVGILYFKVDL